MHVGCVPTDHLTSSLPAPYLSFSLIHLCVYWEVTSYAYVQATSYEAQHTAHSTRRHGVECAADKSSRVVRGRARLLRVDHRLLGQ
jgi:hypothetical protein